ncbi:hypothetical protein QR680_016302 [Steinernema hermaphroditum]|uniref:Uncharacterized protein n=1 Tax=Steinernema hermaphroditum TaxID=289476 RepID=A0AA39HD90_9BILA|nr:hypothetical protein QR680_016302 [Steinernema hermaphroditum]
MSVRYDLLYNRILDVSGVLHVTVKTFTIIIIIRYTPVDMRHMSVFLLNGMVWNYAGNLLFTFIHFYPMYPSECIRADGIVSYFMKDEIVGHILFCAVFWCILNCAIAITFVFPYRYLIFAHAHLMAKVKTVYVVTVCAAIHVSTTVFFLFLYSNWMIRYDDSKKTNFQNISCCFVLSLMDGCN